MRDFVLSVTDTACRQVKGDNCLKILVNASCLINHSQTHSAGFPLSWLKKFPGLSRTQYTLALVYEMYYNGKLHALPNNLPKRTVNKSRIPGCIMQ